MVIVIVSLHKMTNCAKLRKLSVADNDAGWFVGIFGIERRVKMNIEYKDFWTSLEEKAFSFIFLSFVPNKQVGKE